MYLNILCRASLQRKLFFVWICLDFVEYYWKHFDFFLKVNNFWRYLQKCGSCPKWIRFAKVSRFWFMARFEKCQFYLCFLYLSDQNWLMELLCLRDQSKVAWSQFNRSWTRKRSVWDEKIEKNENLLKHQKGKRKPIQVSILKSIFISEKY